VRPCAVRQSGWTTLSDAPHIEAPTRSIRGGALHTAIMAKKLKQRSYEDAVSWFRDHGFELMEAPGASNRVFLRKYKVSAAIERTPDGTVKIFAYPGYVIGGEISKLVDLGHQKVLRTTKADYPATAEHLTALHDFSEELKEGIGTTSLYNEALGTVSESYMYDRVRGRDLPESERPKRPWQEVPSPKAKRA
jgi:hypothetical protein